MRQTLVITSIWLLIIGLTLQMNETMNTKSPDIDHLRCAAWNMRSLSSGQIYLKELMLCNDIIAVSEHGLYDCQLWRLNQVNEQFNVLAKSCKVLNDCDCNRKVGHSGVALFWRATLDRYVKPLNVANSDRMCAIELSLSPNQCIIIVSVYLPHMSSTIANFSEELHVLEDLVDKGNQVNGIIIMGDVYAHFGSEFGGRC